MKKQCFVIMPFSKTTDIHTQEYWTGFYEMILGIMNGMGYECKRSEVGPYCMFNQIVDRIEKSDIVIAILTDANPNVWYELGIRHTLKNGTIMLLEMGQKRPFDVNAYGIVEYDNLPNVEKRLRERITEYLHKLENGTTDSPVINARAALHNDNSVDEIKTELEEVKKQFQMLKDTVWKEAEQSTYSGKRGSEASLYNRVLWVDDHPRHNWYIVSMLRDRNIIVDSAITTIQAIQLYKHNVYDIVITDMERDGQSDAGLDLLKQLKTLDCQSHIIVFTDMVSKAKYQDQAQCLGAKLVASSMQRLLEEISGVYMAAKI